VRKVTFGGACSLDCYFAGPGEALDWLAWSDDAAKVSAESWKGVDTILMGRKTWHGFSPFLGTTVGVGFETGLGTDPSGYQFGTKVLLAPHIGFKWYPLQAFAVKIEGRTYFWRLSYPTTFGLSPGGTITTVLPAGSTFNEWTAHPALLVSLGYTFAPFK